MWIGGYKFLAALPPSNLYIGPTTGFLRGSIETIIYLALLQISCMSLQPYGH